MSGPEDEQVKEPDGRAEPLRGRLSQAGTVRNCGGRAQARSSAKPAGQGLGAGWARGGPRRCPAFAGLLGRPDAAAAAALDAAGATFARGGRAAPA